MFGITRFFVFDNIPIPNDVNLIGGRLMLQAFVPDLASTNALPFTLSNGGELTIGAIY